MLLPYTSYTRYLERYFDLDNHIQSQNEITNAAVIELAAPFSAANSIGCYPFFLNISLTAKLMTKYCFTAAILF